MRSFETKLRNFCSFVSANLSSCTCRAKFMSSPLISWSNNSHVASSTCGRELKLIFDEFSVNSTTDVHVIERHLHLCSRQKNAQNGAILIPKEFKNCHS